MDDNGLVKSREVTRTWLDFIDEKNNLVYPWLRIVKIPTILPTGIGGITYLHLAAEYGQTDMFKSMLEKEGYKNPKNIEDITGTPLHQACFKGKFNIVKILVRNSEKFKIDFNHTEVQGNTAFHYACGDKGKPIQNLTARK